MTTQNVHIRPLMESIFDIYLEDPLETEVDARRAVIQYFKVVFGWKGAWRMASMVTSIDRGFGDVLDAMIAEVGVLWRLMGEKQDACN